MVYFVNKLDLSDQKYKTNGNIRNESYKGKFLFFMKDFVSFGTYCQSMYLMQIIFLIDKINGVHIPQFKISYISGTTHTPHLKLGELCCEVHYTWWGNQNM